MRAHFPNLHHNRRERSREVKFASRLFYFLGISFLIACAIFTVAAARIFRVTSSSFFLVASFLGSLTADFAALKAEL
jgi:hypothetical protein